MKNVGQAGKGIGKRSLYQKKVQFSTGQFFRKVPQSPEGTL